MPNYSSQRKTIGLGATIVLLHVLLLLVVFPALSNRLAPDYNQHKSADGYDYLAANLASGHGYRFYPETAPTTMREPGYPVLLAGLLLLFGDRFIAVETVNLVLALATAWLIVRVVKKFTDSGWPLLVAPALYLFHPGTLIAESRGGVEVLFSFLILLFVLTLLNAIEDQHALSFLVSGLILGITLLVRSVPLLFPLFLLGYLLVFERRKIPVLKICRNVAALVFAMLAVLSPWIARNYSLTGKIIPTASVLGVSAQTGQYIYTHLSEGKPWWLLDREAAHERSRLATDLGLPFEDGINGYYQTFYRTQDEVTFSKVLLGRVVEEHKKQPGQFLQIIVRNLFNFWFAGKTRLATMSNLVVQFPYLVLAAAGVFVGLRGAQRKVVALIVLLIGYIIAIYIPILAQARYSIPLVPFLSILATIALMTAREKIASGERIAYPVPAGVGTQPLSSSRAQR